MKKFFQNKFLKFQISESAKNPKTVTGTAGQKKILQNSEREMEDLKVSAAAKFIADTAVKIISQD